LRVLRRILITVVVTLTVIFVGVSWIAPVVLSFYAARKAPPVARVVPTDLKDQSVSEAPGKKLSYFGYEFQIPWSDLDEAQTKLYPKDKADKTRSISVSVRDCDWWSPLFLPENGQTASLRTLRSPRG